MLHVHVDIINFYLRLFELKNCKAFGERNASFSFYKKSSLLKIWFHYLRFAVLKRLKKCNTYGTTWWLYESKKGKESRGGNKNVRRFRIRSSSTNSKNEVHCRFNSKKSTKNHHLKDFYRMTE